jgi:ABC-type sugar transport system ATPase subunit
MRQDAVKLLTELAVDLPSVDAKVKDLSGGQRQPLPLPRPSTRTARPSCWMSRPRRWVSPRPRKVLDLVKSLKARGWVIYITHNMHDVMDVRSMRDHEEWAKGR